MEENQQLRGYLAGIVLFKNNCEKGAGIDVAKKYEVHVYPTFAMVDASGEVTDRWAGYQGADGFIATVDAAQADPRTIKEKVAAFDEEPTVALSRSLGQYSEAVGANTDAIKYYRKAMVLDSTLAKEMRSQVFMAAFYGLRSGEVTGDQLMAVGHEIMDAPGSDANDYLMVASIAKRVASANDYVPILQKALTATANSDDPEMAEYRQDLLVDEALLIKNDKDEALRLKRDTLTDTWRNDPDEINSFAWWCYENDLNLTEAYDLAMRGADLAADDGTRANILDTAAYIAFKKGDQAKAIELETRAVKLAPDRQGLQRTLEKFKSGEAG